LVETTFVPIATEFMVRHKPKLKAPAGFQSASAFFTPVEAKTQVTRR
jgi:hypothetical protein